MLFVCTMKTLPGKYEEGVRLFKHPKIPDGINIREFLGIFGTIDAIIVFEAPNETVAADFAVQFARVADVSTSLSLPVEEFKWTL